MQVCIETEFSREGFEASSLWADVVSSIFLALLGGRGHRLAWALLFSLIVDIGEVVE